VWDVSDMESLMAQIT